MRFNEFGSKWIEGTIIREDEGKRPQRIEKENNDPKIVLPDMNLIRSTSLEALQAMNKRY